MIDRSTVERIIDTADIVEVIQDFVPLKRRGANFLGLCPFHNEKTPSFTVSPSKGIFKCFGCGKAGNAVNFVMEHEHLSYPDALKFLASKYHIEVEEKELTPEETAKQNERESMLVLSAYASRQFQGDLYQSDEGMSVGLSYFKERGFLQNTLKKFEIGYCINKRDYFSKNAQTKGYQKEFLVKTGLSIDHENGLYDRFRGRVMFPIHSLSGQVLGFGGRILKNDIKTAKYLNSPESEIYHKSRILYGIYQARNAIGKEEKCYLVEGYTDVMALHEAGVENVVASSGTSLTQEQVRLIKRFTPNVTILYDGDPAGIKASLRGIDIVLEEGMNVKIVLLPEGEDPDSYSKKLTREEFVDYLNNKEVDFIKFKTSLLLNETKNDPVAKANVINEIIKSIAVIPESIPRTIYTKECGLLLDMPEEVLFHEVNKIRKQKTFQDRNRYPNAGDIPHIPSPAKQAPKQEETINYSEKEVIRLLLKYNDREYCKITNDETSVEGVMTIADFIVKEIVSDDLGFINETLARIFEEYRFTSEQGGVVEDLFFIKHSDPDISRISADLLSEAHVISRLWSVKQTYVEDEEMKLQHIVDDAVLKFKSDKIKVKIRETYEELKLAVTEKDEEKILELQRKDLELKRILKKISDNLGGRIVL